MVSRSKLVLPNEFLFIKSKIQRILSIMYKFRNIVSYIPFYELLGHWNEKAPGLERSLFFRHEVFFSFFIRVFMVSYVCPRI